MVLRLQRQPLDFAENGQETIHGRINIKKKGCGASEVSAGQPVVASQPARGGASEAGHNHRWARHGRRPSSHREHGLTARGPVVALPDHAPVNQVVQEESAERAPNGCKHDGREESSIVSVEGRWAML